MGNMHWDSINAEHHSHMSNPNWINTYRRDTIAGHYMTYPPYDNIEFITQYYKDVTQAGINILFSDYLLGNPVYTTIDNKIITQDLITSTEEISHIESQINIDKINTILEIGGGYGRTCWLILKKYSNIKKYTIVDVEPALTVAKYHLKNTLSEENFNKINFIYPNEFENNKENYDLSLSISALDEFPQEAYTMYLEEIKNRSIYFYLKCNDMPMVLKSWTGPQYITLPKSKSVPYHTPMEQIFVYLKDK
jgi:hypothetical protein